ncbi:MAG: zf-HC2 domain-containing protein [Dethiobacter sp.]|jgi:anti-sigma factor RsiW|nr:zf-HC2 domain-containing protein [Dethiobacter sp.]MBS3897900.1 zf-HC2 domain-containing protein [Dethiobacter sp.]MBS3982164.1 zf-HC2 domain-containing protein [Dethiobacter sp.]MCL4463027.1 zf-HC2 domain-containing protein [Bacillota bacterium]MCL5993397.1 zf-HC2 domain-containing protein [Bacillota bacterium]
MSCEKFTENMSAYLDGLLSGKELSEFQEHLSVCNRCSQEAEELQSMFSWLKQAGDVAPPKELRKSVLAELKKEQSSKGRRYLPGFSQAVAAAAVLIMLVVGNLSLLPPAPLSDTVPMRATYQEESGAETPPADAIIYTQEAPDNVQFSEKSELNSAAGSEPFPRRLALNLILIPLFLFFSLRVIQKRKEAG